MGLLISGLLLWSLVHFIPSLAQPVKQKWIQLLGDKGYKLSFSAIVVFSLVLIVFGWRSSLPSHLYIMPDVVRHIAMVLMLFAFILFGSAKHPTRIKRFIRHPQLLSVIVWATAHLLLNGDSRSLLLFGWLGAWAALEMILINRREGEWVKEPSPGWGEEFKGLAISLGIFAVVALAHPLIAGVPIK